MYRSLLLAITQFSIYLLVGLAYLLMIGAYLSASAGFGLLGLMFILLPIILGGLLSGMSFFYPRLSAYLAIICVLPFFASGVHSWFANIPASEPLVWTLPSLIAIGASTGTLLLSRDAIWHRSSSAGRVVLALVGAPPALFSIYFLFKFVFWIAGIRP